MNITRGAALLTLLLLFTSTACEDDTPNTAPRDTVMDTGADTNAVDTSADSTPSDTEPEDGETTTVDPPGVLGEDCAEDDDCDSGICVRNTCSSCNLLTDCGEGQRCQFLGSAGYTTCVGFADLGAPCTSGDTCASTFCTDGVCSRCASDEDCGALGTCDDLTAELGYFACQGQLGAVCETNSDCISSYCATFDTLKFDWSACSECNDTSQCDEGFLCAGRNADGTARCVNDDLPDLGASCQSDDDCGVYDCNDGRCSLCKTEDDCAENSGSCVLGSDGWYQCERGLGDAPCESDDDCNSGICRTFACSACREDSCPEGQMCDIGPNLRWETCVGASYIGESCDADADCYDGICLDGECSECETDADCPLRHSCERDDLYGWICKAPVGSSCADDSDCITGMCNLGNCGFCKEDSDCTEGARCDEARIIAAKLYPRCVGTRLLGADCENNTDCQSGVCADGLCGSCFIDADCPKLARCVIDPELGVTVCEGPAGDDCYFDADCGSGICDNAALARPGTCAECEADTDCPGTEECDHAGPEWGARSCN